MTSHPTTKALYNTQLEWNDEQVALLKQLHADGLSASQISARIAGTSRNSVIGKLYRLGLSGERNAFGVSASSARGGPGKYRGAITRARNAREMAVSVRLGRAKADGADTLAEALKKIKPEPKIITGSVWEALPNTSPISLVDASDATCRWPIGDPLLPGFGFCGCAVDDGSVYCPAHRARGTTTFKASAEDKRRLNKSDTSNRVFR